MSVPLSEVEKMLKAKNNKGYGKERIPNDRDREISSLLGSIRLVPDFERIVEILKPEWRSAPVLLAFGERMASDCVRCGSTGPLINGLVGVGLAYQSADSRECVSVLALLFHSMDLLGVDPASILAEAKGRVSPKVGEVFDQFLARSLEDRRLGAMGYRESSDDDGFRYERTW